MRLLFIAAGMTALLSAQPKVDFRKDIAPILENNCTACHSGAKVAKLDRKSVVPGRPDASRLYLMAAIPAGKPGAMPPGGPRLPNDQLATLRRWIEQGAEWPTSAAVAKVDEHEEVRRIHDRIVGIVAHEKTKPSPYRVTIPNTTIAYRMVPIPAGRFRMGSTEKPDEQPVHTVSVDAFWMQEHEVTWDEYRLFMFANQAGEVAHVDETLDAVSRPTRPYAEMSFGMGINGFPAISMTQHAANKYAEWLSAKTGEFYRLPTEAEWEYACRAGSANAGGPLADHAWFTDNSNGKYQKVATRKANSWGLYDMLGNVMEWTLDQYAPYQAGEKTNPWVVATEPYPHAVRGGSWNDPAEALRCAARTPSDSSWKQQDPQLPKSIWYHTDAQWLGFRLVRPAQVPDAAAMFRYWNNGVEHDER